MNAKRQANDGQAASREMPRQHRREGLDGHTAITHQRAGRRCHNEAGHDLDQVGAARRLIQINIAEYEECPAQAPGAPTELRR